MNLSNCYSNVVGALDVFEQDCGESGGLVRAETSLLGYESVFFPIAAVHNTK